MFEALEMRRLMSTVTQSGSLLTVNGGSGDDMINVRESNHTVVVDYYNNSGTFTTVTKTGITRININGRGGDDSIFYTGNTVGANIHGDNVSSSKGGSGGSGGSDDDNWHGCHRYGRGKHGGNGDGGNGNDFITVDDEGSGSSVIDGDGGNDDLTVIKGNWTLVYGGVGNDNIYLNTAGSANSCNYGETIVFAEAGNDVVTAYSGLNIIFGDGGKDTFIDLGGVNFAFGFETVVSA